MRLSSSVDYLSKENKFLKMIITMLFFPISILAIGLLVQMDRPPLLLEETANGFTLLKPTPLKRSEESIQHALRHMIESRFDSKAINSELFLSPRQIELREAEQKELQSRGINQVTVYRGAKVNKDGAIVEFDRVLSVGDVRSAMKVTLNVVFTEVQPNATNPYGLLLALANPITKEEK